MRIISRMKTRTGSVVSMALASVLLVSVVEFMPTNKTNKNNKEVKVSTEAKETKLSASINPVDNNIVGMSITSNEDSLMETVQDVSEKEKETKAKEEAAKPKSAFDGKFMANVSESVNIRSAADPEADVVGKLYSGAGGDVLEKGDEWTKISSGSVVGYVATDYLAFDADAETVANKTVPYIATVTAETVKVRTTNDTNSEVIALAEEGAQFVVLGRLEDWEKIDYNGKEGYISSELVSVEQTIGTAITIEEEQARIKAEEEAKAAKEAAEAQAQAEVEEAAKAEAQAQEEVASNEVQTETVQTESYGASTDDSYLLACLVAAEAGSEPYEGKLAVANVVLNRLYSGAYGSSISDVIYAPGQFSVTTNGRLSRIFASGPDAGSIQAANDALAGVNNVPNYRSFRALSAANYGAYNNYTVIGNQVFFN